MLPEELTTNRVTKLYIANTNTLRLTNKIAPQLMCLKDCQLFLPNNPKEKFYGFVCANYCSLAVLWSLKQVGCTLGVNLLIKHSWSYCSDYLRCFNLLFFYLCRDRD